MPSRVSLALWQRESDFNGATTIQHPDKNRYPVGWDADRVRDLIKHYEEQSQEEAVAEDEDAWEDQTQTTIEIPIEILPVVRELIAKRSA